VLLAELKVGSQRHDGEEPDQSDATKRLAGDHMQQPANRGVATGG
jgi:hypothetical protein